jgi:hypothetical protein
MMHNRAAVRRVLEFFCPFSETYFASSPLVRAPLLPDKIRTCRKRAAGTQLRALGIQHHLLGRDPAMRSECAACTAVGAAKSSKVPITDGPSSCEAENSPWNWLGPQRGKILVTGLETLAILLTINCQKVAARISGTLRKAISETNLRIRRAKLSRGE